MTATSTYEATMIPTIATLDPHDEPTKPGNNLAGNVLVTLARIVHRAAVCRERLLVAVDDDALAAAVDDLDAIAELASEVAS